MDSITVRLSATSAGKILPIILVSLALSGCGGGGGGGVTGGGGTNPTVTPPPSQCISTSEGCLTPTQYRNRVNAIKNTLSSHPGFSNQWGLGRVKADAAWAKVKLKHGLSTAPGAGITLGAIDSGIDTGHHVFSGKRKAEIFMMGATNEDGSSDSHGTSVASVMVANPNQSFIDTTTGARGVAWGADITMIAIPTSSEAAGMHNFVPISLASLNYWNHTSRWPAVINRATGWSSGGRSLDFVNVSLGFPGLIDFYSTSDLTSNFNNVINAIKQTSGSNSNTVFVWSAGNSHGNPCSAADFPTGHKHRCSNGKVNAVSPNVLAGLPARISSLRSNHIAVVSVASNGAISSWSNRCGIAANWCIAAPGQSIRTAFFGPDSGQPGQRGSYTVSGTSFAAPHVTGGLAVMKHFFRSQLSNTALVRRLYATANKTGRYSNRSIYGQGLMDLNAAVSPVGASHVATGNRVGDGGRMLADTYLNPGPAFGDGLNLSLTNQEIVAFDELGAPFWYSLGGFAGARSGPPIQSLLRSFMNSTANDREPGKFRPVLGALPAEFSSLDSGRLSLGLTKTPDFLHDGGHLSLLGRSIAFSRPIGNRLGFSLFSNEVNDSRSKVSGMQFVSRPAGLPISFRGGAVDERRTLLSGSAGGAFGRLAGSSAFAGLEGGWRAGAWRLGAGAEIGAVVAGDGQGLLSIRSPLTTSAFALRASRRIDERDTVDFALSQPVRIESGRAGYTIPVGRTVDGEVLRVSNSVDLEPSGRQTDLSAQWSRSLPAGDFRLAAGLSVQPGHSAAADPELSVLAGWRVRY